MGIISKDDGLDNRFLGEHSEIESLRNESLQLKGLLVGEIEALESSLSAREEGESTDTTIEFFCFYCTGDVFLETKNARATAKEYADKYGRECHYST